MKVIVVIPTYNEAENVAPMSEALWGLGLPGLEILIVDDESPDGTGDIADRLTAENPDRLHVLHRTGSRGLGRAYVEGFRWALAHGAEAVVQMDCDFSHAPTDVPRLLAHLPEYDVVVGSRYVEGGRTDEEWGMGRAFLSWWANFYARLILGCRVRDITAGFKAWRREALEGIDLGSIHSQGYVFQVEMTYVCERLGYRILEVPIYFEDRRIGRSKMTIPVKIEAALRVWEVRWRHRHLQPIHKGV
ncbi:MAG TPA: polyprenol monophosphomannose synthase [Anaerolineales bacterium]|nr:polyprenol monophosphomannose synthase [Anaerolineae bacterium]HIQ01304.1 polyprenol monophosphomannose synthase [Anaerolineales bacterium]